MNAHSVVKYASEGPGPNAAARGWAAVSSYTRCSAANRKPIVPSPAIQSTSSPRRAMRTVWWLLATAVGVLLLFEMNAHGVSVRSVASACLFRRVTGVACPGCGLTRAFFALASGEWREAVRLHPLAPFVALECIAVWVISGVWATGSRLRFAPARLERFAERAILFNVALFVLVWGVRWYFHALPA
jgi:hypothetical protein